MISISTAKVEYTANTYMKSLFRQFITYLMDILLLPFALFHSIKSMGRIGKISRNASLIPPKSIVVIIQPANAVLDDVQE